MRLERDSRLEECRERQQGGGSGRFGMHDMIDPLYWRVGVCTLAVAVLDGQKSELFFLTRRVDSSLLQYYYIRYLLVATQTLWIIRTCSYHYYYFIAQLTHRC